MPPAVDTFTSGALSTVPHYDAAGNLTDDGQYEYVYDAWNRLVEVWRHGPQRTRAQLICKGGEQPLQTAFSLPYHERRLESVHSAF